MGIGVQDFKNRKGTIFNILGLFGKEERCEQKVFDIFKNLLWKIDFPDWDKGYAHGTDVVQIER